MIFLATVESKEAQVSNAKARKVVLFLDRIYNLLIEEIAKFNSVQ